MIDACPEIRREYEWWSNQVGIDDPYDTRCVIGVRDVLRAHFLLIDYFFAEGQGIGGVGPRDLNLLYSAVGRQDAGFGLVRKWYDPFDACATLSYGLIKNHPFHDANKRTALLTALFFLQRIKRTPTAGERELEELTLRVANNELKKYLNFGKFAKRSDADVLFISNFFRRNTRQIDKRSYIITYRQLSSILNRFGFRFANHHDHYIDIVRDVERVTGLFRKRKEIVTERVAQINFPGWKLQVNSSTIKKVRQDTRLTAKDGVDSQAFFHDVDPMEALIATYKGPLQRLAYR